MSLYLEGKTIPDNEPNNEQLGRMDDKSDNNKNGTNKLDIADLVSYENWSKE